MAEDLFGKLGNALGNIGHDAARSVVPPQLRSVIPSGRAMNQALGSPLGTSEILPPLAVRRVEAELHTIAVARGRPDLEPGIVDGQVTLDNGRGANTEAAARAFAQAMQIDPPRFDVVNGRPVMERNDKFLSDLQYVAERQPLPPAALPLVSPQRGRTSGR